jgi:hypothetical protein
MAKTNSASENTGSDARDVKGQQLVDLRRLVLETEEAIVRSRALIRSTRNSIELLDRLQVRRGFKQQPQSESGRPRRWVCALGQR